MKGDTMSNNSENEVKRRRKVVEEKMWGGLIEFVERKRKEPVARSITFRLYFLYQSISEFQKTVKAMGKDVDPVGTIAPPFTTEQTNFLIRTYNNVIKDLHLHFGKKDSYVRSFSAFSEIDEPTINDVAKILFTMGTNISQIICYMIRWR
jgi:hypothetical protein